MDHEKRRDKSFSAFELWVWRRKGKVSWMDKRTNEQVLSTMNEKRSLIKNNMGQKEELDWTCCKGRWSDEIGVRRENGRIETKGRPRIGMIDDVLDETYGDMKRKA